MIRLHGKALSQSVRLYGCAFCRDYNNHNFPAGYADTHVRPSLPYLSGLISDNSTFFNTLSSQFQLPPSMAARYIVLLNPAPCARTRTRKPGNLLVSTLRPKNNFKVLWASRFTRQKNINLLKKIVKAAPDIMFDIWGRGEEEAALNEYAASCSNMAIKGSYSSFANIPLNEYSAFLYTSLWDGIPNVLLEAAGADLPIVSANVGGIGELVDSDTGWLIENLQSEVPYVDALREIQASPTVVELRKKSMRERLKRQHSWETFIQSMKLAGILERA
jgi:glycosyltransferase involved in cell wall biosynthesis